MNTTVGRYALGVASLLIMGASLSLAAVAVRRRWFARSTGAVARLTEVVIGLALLIAILQLLGLVGLFALAPIAVASVVAGWGTRRLVGAPALGRSPERYNRFGVEGLCALVAAALVAAEWGSPTIESYDVGIRGFDSLWYHLPWAATFAQTAQITPLRFTDVEYLTAFYPATAELLHGLGIVLLARDTLSPGLNLVWLGLSLLAAWCIGRPSGRGAATAIGAALGLAVPMMTFSQAGSAANDVVGVFFLLAAVALLLNGSGSRPSVVLAAAAAGLAVSVKLTLLAPIAALTVAVIAVAPARVRGSTALAWLGPLLVAGGFWYLRNLIAVGNPLPWTSAGILATPAAPLQQHSGYAVLRYLTSSRVYGHFIEPGVAAGLGRWWPVVLALAVIGPLLCVLLPGSGRLLRGLGLVAIASLAAYLVTPETAAGPAGDPAGFAFNLRYLAPALTLSLVVAPLAPTFDRPRFRLALVGVMIGTLIATVAKPSLWPGAHLPAAVALGLFVLVIGIVVEIRSTAPEHLRREAHERLRRLREWPRWGLIAVAVTLIAAGGYLGQRHYLRGRYAYAPGVSYLAKVWAFFRTIHRSRVGLVGTFGGFFSYPLYGEDDSNRVQYIARSGAHGSFTPITSCSRWRAAVDAAHLRYLVLTPSRDPWHPATLAPSPETAWTASAPAARVVFSGRAQGLPIVVYELDGPLSPSRCP